MLVTDQKQHVTHAVMGGGQSIDFGISSDPAFFQILSSSLYKNSKKAVVRETICNANDAHIDGGVTLPIHITFTDEELVIRDFGKGIPDALIGPIYAVYGGSTKKNDGKQTGGFGLGCKAPFAYTDTFTVTSWNQGIKTVYVMSKSSNEVQGKPSIRPIMQAPTDETGLEVRIPIAWHDRSKFLELVKEIIFFGGINALINDRAASTINYESAVNGFIQLPCTEEHMREQRNCVLVKYGNVVYPIEEHVDYKLNFRLANDALNWRNNNHTYDCLILLAPPDSISVTPSREALSIQDNTLATLTAILDNFTSMLSQTETIGKAAILQQAEEAATAGKMTLLMKHQRVPFKDENAFPPAVTIEQLAARRIHHEHRQNHVPTYYADHCDNLMVQHKILPRKGLEAVKLAARRAQTRGYRLNNGYASGKWAFRNIVARLLTRMPEGMLRSRLVFKSKSFGWGGWKKYKLDNTQVLDQHARELLTNTVVLSHLSEDYEGRLRNFPEMKQLELDSHLLYHVPRSKKKEEEARAYFKRMGCRIFDLTVAHHWEDDSVVEPEKRDAPAKKRVVGIPMLSVGLLDNGGNDMAKCMEDGATRLENPAWVGLFTNSMDSRMDCYGKHETRLGHLSGSDTTTVLQLFGHEGGMCRNTPQLELYKTKGAKLLFPYVFLKLTEAFTKNVEIMKFVASGALDQGAGSLLQIIHEDDELRTHFGLTPYNLAPEDTALMTLWRGDFKCNSPANPRLIDEGKAAEAAFSAIQGDPASIVLGDKLTKFKDKPEAKFYDLSELKNSIRLKDANAALARQIIINSLK